MQTIGGLVSAEAPGIHMCIPGYPGTYYKNIACQHTSVKRSYSESYPGSSLLSPEPPSRSHILKIVTKPISFAISLTMVKRWSSSVVPENNERNENCTMRCEIWSTTGRDNFELEQAEFGQEYNKNECEKEREQADGSNGVAPLHCPSHSTLSG
jgi:hypothetical protein